MHYGAAHPPKGSKVAAVAAGAVLRSANVAALRPDGGVELVDGTVIPRVDTVLYCTGGCAGFAGVQVRYGAAGVQVWCGGAGVQVWCGGAGVHRLVWAAERENAGWSAAQLRRWVQIWVEGKKK